MGIIDKIAGWAPWGQSDPVKPAPLRAATNLTPIEPPRVKAKPAAMPSHFKRSGTQKGGSRIQEADRQVARTDLLTYRSGRNTKEVVRNLAATSPDLSASNNAYARLVVTPGYSCTARDEDGSINPQATQAVQAIINRMNFLGDYTDGFSGMNSIHALGEMLVRELRNYGSCSAELVLDKALLPSRIQPISTTQIEFMDDGRTNYTYPVQKVSGGVDINLDIPTFFYETLDQDLLDAYSSSPLESAVQATLADTEFQNDVRRIIKKALHPRLSAQISLEMFTRYLPSEVSGDDEKTAEYKAAFIAAIQDEIGSLDVDDALVAFDNIDFSYLSRGSESLSQEYTTLQKIVDSKVSSGAKAPGAVLGHASGSQNIASTETMLFVKYATGYQQKINSLFSRALTLGVRLMGFECYVQFRFDAIDLRPESELEGFKQMKQERILTQLSVGLISDEDACIELTGRLPPPGYTPLSGTHFKSGSTPDSALGNAYSNTSASNSSGAVGQTLTPSTPSKAKGPAK